MYRLLVVDDEKDIRENIQYLIDWSRYGINQIETAATYEEAVNKALDIRPHIILMDVKLGDGRCLIMMKIMQSYLPEIINTLQLYRDIFLG